jgi:hypothetical protein
MFEKFVGGGFKPKILVTQNIDGYGADAIINNAGSLVRDYENPKNLLMFEVINNKINIRRIDTTTGSVTKIKILTVNSCGPNIKSVAYSPGTKTYYLTTAVVMAWTVDNPSFTQVYPTGSPYCYGTEFLVSAADDDSKVLVVIETKTTMKIWNLVDKVLITQFTLSGSDTFLATLKYRNGVFYFIQSGKLFKYTISSKQKTEVVLTGKQLQSPTALEIHQPSGKLLAIGSASGAIYQVNLETAVSSVIMGSESDHSSCYGDLDGEGVTSDIPAGRLGGLTYSQMVAIDSSVYLATPRAVHAITNTPILYCPAGYFSTVSAIDDLSECKKCPVKTYAPDTGSTTCLPCRYASTEGSTECITVPEYFCYGKSSMSSQVCSGKGTCTS